MTIPGVLTQEELDFAEKRRRYEAWEGESMAPLTAADRVQWPLPGRLTLSALNSLAFGEVRLAAEHQPLRVWLNRRVLAFCDRMPAALRDSALLAVQAHLTRYQACHVATFYDKYYPPAWTVIPFLAGSRSGVAPGQVHDALSAQAAAMFLHLLDDHLTDGDIPVDNLFLQLRTEVWDEFRNALGRLAGWDQEAKRTVESLVDLYFSRIHRPSDRPDLAAYEEVFRGQAATFLIAPLLMAVLAGYDTGQRRLIRSMYEEFCLAWRILDDLRDTTTDAAADRATAVFHLLPPEDRAVWHEVALDPSDGERRDALLEVLRCAAYPAAAQAIHTHLATAAHAADELDLPGLGEQYRALALPLEKNLKEECHENLPRFHLRHRRQHPPVRGVVPGRSLPRTDTAT